MAPESMPCVYGSVASVDSDPPPTLTTTATVGNSTLTLCSDLDGEVFAKPAIAVGSQATHTQNDVAPMVPMISGPNRQLETEFDDVVSEDEVGVVSYHDMPQVNCCQDDPDCPFCGPHAECLFASDCDLSDGECDDDGDQTEPEGLFMPETKVSVVPPRNM